MRLNFTALVFLTFLTLLPAGANSEDFCVSTAAELQTALTQAQNNNEADVIKLVQNVYVGNFLYASTKGHGLTIEGGYAAGCGSRNIDPQNTVLRDSSGDTPILVVTDLNLISDFIVEGVKLERTVANPSDVIVYAKGATHQVETSSFNLWNCIILGNNSQSYGSHGLEASNFDNLNVVKNSISNNMYGIYLENIIHSVLFEQNNGFYNSDAAFMAVSCNGEMSISYNNIYENGGGAKVGNISGNNFDPINIEAIQNNIYNNNGSAFQLTGSKVNAFKNKIWNNNGNGIYVYSENWINIFHNVIDKCNYGSGIAIASGRAWIVNNLISSCQNLLNYGSIFENPGYGGGICINTGDGCKVINNTIVNNYARYMGGGIYIATDYGDFEPDVYNNIICNNEAPQGSQLCVINDRNGDYFSLTLNLFNNLFNQDASSTYIQRPFCIHESNLDNRDPQFADSNHDDYHIIRTSPCLDAGSNSAPQLPDTDLDGIPRIQNNFVDIGCYEMKSPLAGFEVERRRGVKPFQVQFQNTCYGNVSSYHWRFGDGATSTDPNPIHEYDEYARYSVSLEVVGTGGTDLITKNDYISVVPFPVGILNMLLSGGN